jgi:hypothetical protein
MADTGLFARLKRLFSTDVVIRNVGGNELQVIDTDKIQTSGEFATNSLMSRYQGIYSNPAATSLLGAQFNLNYQYLEPIFIVIMKLWILMLLLHLLLILLQMNVH